MKVIDFSKKGNVVRLYLGDDNCTDYWGDDWDDAPYEHNAGTVYDEYVLGYVDIAFSFNTVVLEPKEDWRYDGNSPYSKKDMKKHNVPCIIIAPQWLVETFDDYYVETFSHWLGNKYAIKVYFDDDISGLLNLGMTYQLTDFRKTKGEDSIEGL